MILTVAICTYNPRVDLLARVLGALAPQVDRNDVELIIIDNNSSPPVEAAAFENISRVRVVHEPKQGLTAARERAIAEARGDIILFVDDDNVLSPNFIVRLLEIFRKPTVGMVGGAVYPEYEIAPPRWIGRFEECLAIRRHPPDCYVETLSPPCTRYFPIGAGFAVRRNIAVDYVQSLPSMGRIEGRKGGALLSGEDTDLALFVLSRSSSLIVSGQLTLTHVITAKRVELGYLRNLIIGIMEGSAELDKKWTPRFTAPITGALSYPLWKIAIKLLMAGCKMAISKKDRLIFCQMRHWLEIRRRPLKKDT